MSTEIYYFTGTGNSFAVARDIAEKANARLISIASVVNNESIKTDADTIGIVFPVFFGAVLGGIPLIIRRFINKLQDLNSKYVFAVGTYGLGQPDFRVMRDLIQKRGGELPAAFAVKMPFHYLALCGFGQVKNQNKILTDWQTKLKFICDAVHLRKKRIFETSSFLINTILAPLGRLFYRSALKKMTGLNLPSDELLLLMDECFQLTEKCDGCGICSRVCPVNNISIENEKPSWHHRCEHCCACIQWCPRQAIHYGGFAANRNGNSYRSHHLNVGLSDILRI